MKITLIGHAAILIDIDGMTILSDPWWRGPCFGAQWWNYPLPHLASIEGRHIDYIYISHGHHDHFHPGTLATLPKTAKVLVSADIGLAASVRELGFEVIEIGSNEAVTLAGSRVTCRIMRTHVDDTLLGITDGNEVCLNLNDALHSAPRSVQAEFIQRLTVLYPRIDYVFCGYGTASHFPNCYVIPGKNRAATAAHRQRYFNAEWSRIIAQLRPAYGFPFAADVAFFENDLLWVNESTHNSTRPTATFGQLYPQSKVATIDIAPGFVIADGKIQNDVRRQPVSEMLLRQTCADQIERANRFGAVDQASVDDVLALLEKNLAISAQYLGGYHANYRFLIQFHNSKLGIQIEKKGKAVSLASVRIDDIALKAFDLMYTTRLPYLKWALTRPFGDEIMLVGSGGVFEYTDRANVRHNLHRELILLLKKQTSNPQPRYGSDSKLMFEAKQRIKRFIGRETEDLYDLNTWTVFD